MFDSMCTEGTGELYPRTPPLFSTDSGIVLMSTNASGEEPSPGLRTANRRVVLRAERSPPLHRFGICAHEHKLHPATNPHLDCARQMDEQPLEQRCLLLFTDSENVLMSTKLFLRRTGPGLPPLKGCSPFRAEIPSSSHKFRKCVHEHKMPPATNPFPDCARHEDMVPF